MTDDNPSFAFVFRGGLRTAAGTILAEADVAGGQRRILVWVASRPSRCRAAAKRLAIRRSLARRETSSRHGKPLRSSGVGFSFAPGIWFYGHFARLPRTNPACCNPQKRVARSALAPPETLRRHRFDGIPATLSQGAADAGWKPYGPTCEPVAGLITEFFRALNDIGEGLLQAGQ